MNLKEQITKMVESISKDKNLQEQFRKEPVKALESVLGVDLPPRQETSRQASFR